MVQSQGSDARYGVILRTVKHTHLGVGNWVETEGGVEKYNTSWEYHWSGQPAKRSQTIDALTVSVQWGYDLGGNRTSVTPSGSGASPWTQQYNLKPQYHATNPDADAFNRTAIEKNGSTHLITREGSYLGLSSKVKYGDYASIKGQVSLGYDLFLRLSSVVSNEGTPALALYLTRDPPRALRDPTLNESASWGECWKGRSRWRADGRA